MYSKIFQYFCDADDIFFWYVIIIICKITRTHMQNMERNVQGNE